MTLTTRARAPRSDAAQNREALLVAARGVLNDDPGASLETVAKAAGLSRRTLYGHFATREALVGELIREGGARVLSALDAVEHPDPRVELAQLGMAMWQEVRDVQFAAASTTLHGPMSGELGPVLDIALRRVLDAVARARAAGTARTDLPTETVARLMVGISLTVLDEAAAARIPFDEAPYTVAAAVLGLLGLSASEAEPVLAEARGSR